MTSLILVLCSLLTMLTCATTNNVFYVKPNDDFYNGTCPSPCYTLSEYAQVDILFYLNAVYNLSEAEMKFLPGEHYLENSIFRVYGLNKFTMTGSEGNASSAIINLGNNTALVNINQLEISWLTLAGLPKSFRFFVINNENIAIHDSVITKCSGIFGFIGLFTNSVATFKKLLIKENTISATELLEFDQVTVDFSENTFSHNFSPIRVAVLLGFNLSSGVFSDNVFVGNHGRGALIFTYKSQIALLRSNNFTMNTGRSILADSSSIFFDGVTEFVSNNASFGPITLINSILNLTGSTAFVKNNAYTFGGAIAMSSDSFVFFNDNASVLFDSNSAGNRGGAIYVFDVKACLTDITTTCPLIMGQNFSLEFINNTGLLAGDDIYGGNLNSSTLGPNCANMLLNSSNVKISLDNNTISSDPNQVCLCNNFGIVCCPDADDFHQPACNEVTEVGTLFPGQNLTIQVVAVGQLWGATPAEVRAVHGKFPEVSEERVYREEVLGLTIWVNNLNATCTTISHPLSVTPDLSLSMSLFPDNVCDMEHSLVLRVNFTSSCPPGFMLSGDSCLCDERLQQFTGVFCDINDQTIQHTGNMWVGYHNTSGLIIHSSPCPFDYCITGQEVIFDMNNTNKQCDHDRSAHLCGQCSSGLSEMFGGTSECRECSNNYLALLIPFSLAGIALLVFLFLLRLTVNYGTLSGLILFANVIQVNRSVFIPNGHTSLLTVFIAWLNLDLGIETCFYNGMDAYGRTWLQFVFPFYIWALCGLIIFLSSRSMRVTKLLGSNPVAVLATLFLLSYIKVFRTIIATFSVTSLKYSHESVHVWLLDGNIEMQSGKHIALLLFALLVFVVLFIPFTLLLLFDQWLQPFSHWRILSWAKNSKLRAFLDTYHAPYKVRHRYWTGLLLLFRIILAVVNAFAVAYDRSYSFKLIAIVAVVFFCLLWVGRVYRKWPLYLLESSFLVNLGLLAIAMYHVHTSGKYDESDKAPYFNASVSIALITFVGVLIYHFYMIFRKSKLVGNVTLRVKSKLHPKHDDVKLPADNQDITLSTSQQQRPTISSTVVELREPLLDDCDTY